MKKIVVLLVIVVAMTGCRQTERKATSTAASGTAAPQTQTAPQTPAADGALDVGSTLPAYTAKWLDGSTFDVAAKRDKVLLLNLWATWCGPCRYEIPELQAVHDKYASRGFEVIGVSVDQSGADAVKQFVDEHKMTYPVVLDAEERLANILDVSVLPTSIIVDRSGRIVWKKIGAVMPNDTELTAAIEKALL